MGRLCLGKLPKPQEAWGSGNESLSIFIKDFYNIKPEWGMTTLNLPCHASLPLEHHTLTLVLFCAPFHVTLLPWRFLSWPPPLLFSSALVVAVSDAVTGVASGPMRPPGRW